MVVHENGSDFNAIRASSSFSAPFNLAVSKFGEGHQMKNPIERLYELLGTETVLLPIPLRQKRPLLKGWPKLNVAHTKTPDYQRKLSLCIQRGGNIGVLLGPASHRLVAIDIDDDQLVDEILALNPWLHGTLRSRGRRGCQFWLRLKPGTSYPNTQAVYMLKLGNGKEYGEWRCGGGLKGAQSVIWGVHPEGNTYQILVDKPPLEIDFASIEWLAPWEHIEPQQAKGGFPAKSERPCYCVYQHQMVVAGRTYESGVYLHSIARKDDKTYFIDEWICAPLVVSAKTANREDSEYGRLLEFMSSNGLQKKWSMPMTLLAGDGTEILQQLYQDGLEVHHPSRRKIPDYISRAQPSSFLLSATRTGWHSKDSFVLPDEVIGKGGIWFQSNRKIAAYAKAGSDQSWRDLVAARAKGNPFLMLAISFALCGPLLERLNFVGAGLHFFGDTTIGKTTVLSAGGSVWGGEKYLRTWRATANGMEGVGVQHTDTLLVLDEISEIQPKDLDECAYFLINGQGKTRSNRYGEARPIQAWRVAILSSGEQSIRAKLQSGNILIKAGQTLRILDVPVKGAYGMFENLHGFESGAKLADSIRYASAEHYGHAGPAFVKAIVGLDVSALAAQHEEILGAFREYDKRTGKYKEFENQVRRGARIFALAALAGELATKAGIVPWDEDDASNAAFAVFNAWKDARETSGLGQEHFEILRAIADFIDRHGSSRFSDVKFVSITPNGFDPPMIRDRAGYWDDSGASRVYLFTGGSLREATKGFEFRRVIHALEQVGAFVKTGSDKKAVATRTPDNRVIPLYHVDPQKLST